MPGRQDHTEMEMQLSFNKRGSAAAATAAEPSQLRRLADLQEGEAAIIEHIDLPADFATRLMELGFLPGMLVTAARCAPGGDPRVFRVDGSEVALRKETASQLLVKM
jgi:ferrous iron transport protein A